MNLGQFIKQKRLNMRLTLKQVANSVGVSEMTVSRWERNEVKHVKSSHIEALSKTLCIPIMSLFDGWDENGNKIEFEQISPQEFAIEVKQLLNKTENLSDQQKQFMLNTLDLICSDDNKE